MGDPHYCLSNHEHIDWSRHGTIAGGREYLLHKLRCMSCGTQVQITETPTEIKTRKKVVRDGASSDQ